MQERFCKPRILPVLYCSKLEKYSHCIDVYIINKKQGNGRTQFIRNTHIPYINLCSIIASRTCSKLGRALPRYLLICISLNLLQIHNGEGI